MRRNGVLRESAGGGSLAILASRLRTNTERDAGTTAVLVEDGRITRIGGTAEIRDLAEAKGIRVYDCPGATVTPGLFDSHTHPLWAADVTTGIDLGGLQTLDEVRSALAMAHDRLDDGEWLLGWNLEYSPFDGEGIRRDLIEAAAPGRPVALIFYDLHTVVASAEALRLAGVTRGRVFDDASEIVVDRHGRPTGELREPSAYEIVLDAAPKPTRSADLARLRDMFRQFAATGLTGGAILDGGDRLTEMLAELEARGELDQRVYVHHWHSVQDDDEVIERVIRRKDDGGRLWRSGGIKLFSDGVIDTGTAWLHTADTCGDGLASFWPDWGRYEAVVRRYHDAGMLITTHAVGDHAVGKVLAVYESLPERRNEPFHSIEHLEVLTDADVQKLEGSRVTASMQPLHMQWRAADGSDNWATRLGGARSRQGYRVRDLIDAGVRVVLGSDWPVAQYDPRIGMAWARGRHAPGDSGAPVFEPEQRITGEEALLAYTLWPAQARGHQDRGFLGEGAIADLTVWGQDPVDVSADDLPHVPVLLTIVDGRVVFEADPRECVPTVR